MKSRKKVLFIQPTIYQEDGTLVKTKKLYFVGLSYPVLASYLPPHWEAEICIETIEDIPWDTDADLIGLGGMGHAAKRSKDIALRFKAMGKTVVMGGPMASLAPDLAGEFFDSVVIGDGEDAWPALIADFEQGRLQGRYHMPLKTLSRPIPRYDLVIKKPIGDFLPVQAGRGCPNTCSFCSIHCIYRGSYIRRGVEEVIRDLVHIKSLGFKKFLLIDDNILSEPAYLRDLCLGIKPLAMTWMSQCSIDLARDQELLNLVKAAGCYALSFGLETISPKNLASVHKTWAKPQEYTKLIETVTRSGIEVASEMIIGLDEDSPQSLRETVAFIKASSIIAPKFYILTPIPGTDLYFDYCKSQRLVTKDVFEYSPSKAVITHPNFSTQGLTDALWKVYREVYTIKAIFKRCIFHKRFFTNPGRYLFFLMVNLVYRSQIHKKISPNIL